MNGLKWTERRFTGEAYALPTDLLYYIEGANRPLDAYVRDEERLLNRLLERQGKRLIRIGMTPDIWSQYLALRPDVEDDLPMPEAMSPLSGKVLYRLPQTDENGDYIFLEADVSYCTPDEFRRFLLQEPEYERTQPVCKNKKAKGLGRLIEVFSTPEAECDTSFDTPEYPLNEEENECFSPSERTLPSCPRRTAHYAPANEVKEQFLTELETALGKLSEEGMNIFLQTLGNDLLQSLSRLAPKPVSPVLVDEHFRILLPGYDMEIKMNALWKAIYILFLRHPEGIVLKQMPSFRDELAHIYYAMGCGEYERMEATLDDVTMPGSDNFRQYLSKINHAFTSVLAADLAQHYIISGQRGKEYRIRAKSEVAQMTDKK